MQLPLPLVRSLSDSDDHDQTCSPRCARIDGFTLHADTWVDTSDRDGLLRVCRYAARPPLALWRLSRTDEGKVAYRLKRPLRDGRTRLELEPVAFLRRLAALVPPPRSHLVRYHGILASHSAGRAQLVAGAGSPLPPAPSPDSPAQLPKEPPPLGETLSSFATEVVIGAAKVIAGVVNDLASAAGEASARVEAALRPRYLDWAALLQRVFEVDVLTCARCGGRMRVLAFLTEQTQVTKVLTHLGLPTTPLPIAPARAPPQPELIGWHDDDHLVDALPPDDA